MYVVLISLLALALAFGFALAFSKLPYGRAKGSIRMANQC